MRRKRYTGPYRIPDSDEIFQSVALAMAALDRRFEEKLPWRTPLWFWQWNS